MKRSLKLKDVEARKALEASDLTILRKLESLLLIDDPLVIERENLRKVIRDKEKE